MKTLQNKIRQVVAQSGNQRVEADTSAGANASATKLEFNSETEEGEKTIYEFMGDVKNMNVVKVKETHPRHGTRTLRMSKRKWQDLVEKAEDAEKEGLGKVYVK
jgi:hypothetical protein